MANDSCPICKSVDGSSAEILPIPERDRSRISCPACGVFEMSRSVLADPNRLTAEQRRAISHQLRWQTELSKAPPFLTTSSIGRFEQTATLPSVGDQIDNTLRFLALRLRHLGREYKSIDPALISAIGAYDKAGAASLLLEMKAQGWVSGENASSNDGGLEVDYFAPTLNGWLRVGEIERGRQSEDFAFMAMKYGDLDLEACVEGAFRPAMSELGYGLEILRDRPVAGLIDNLLRARLRLCKFVIADLSHGNNGAYWEAGFAEGLGKPVIYTCEKSVFEELKTHFDTNHSQTIVWSPSDLEGAKDQLRACVQNTFAS